MNTARKFVLFFIDGPVASETDRENVDRIIAANPRFNVAFRNAQGINPLESLERCDFVAGCVPAPYEACDKDGKRLREPLKYDPVVIAPETQEEKPTAPKPPEKAGPKAK